MSIQDRRRMIDEMPANQKAIVKEEDNPSFEILNLGQLLLLLSALNQLDTAES